MKKTLLLFAALALAFCSCDRINNSNKQNQDQPTQDIPSQTTEQPAEPVEEEVIFGIGDLNHDGFMDSAVITMKEVYRSIDEGVTPVQGDGLKIFFGDKQGKYTLFRSYPINNHPDELYACWDGIIVEEDGSLVIEDLYRTDGEVLCTYVLKYQDDDFYLTDFHKGYGTDDDNYEHYDLVNKTLTKEAEWHEMDTEIYHYRTDTYELKDTPLKKLSGFRIGDEVCSFEDVDHVDEDIFEVSGMTKEELCSAEYNPEYDEGDLNGDGIDDLVINVNNSRFAVYFRYSNGCYAWEFEGKSCDDWTETSAYVEDGNLMVYAFTESSKEYTFHYDNGYFRLISFEQFMDWPDGGGSYYQFIDFVNGKRIEREDDNPETTVDIPQKPLRVIEEFHFGNIDEVEDF